MSDLRLLSAEWHRVAMLHYEVDAAPLQTYVPPGTELDLWRGKAIVSVVAFLSKHTRVFGMLPAALSSTFAQINLRTYVRRPGTPGEPHVGPDGYRHGVTFLTELVPRPLLASFARTYGEPYVTAATRNDFNTGEVRYGWYLGGAWNELLVTFEGSSIEMRPGSEAEFFAMRHWGYNRRGDKVRECRVEHPRWRYWNAMSAHLWGGFGELVPPWLASALAGEPRSAYLAAGSPATLFHVGSFSP